MILSAIPLIVTPLYAFYRIKKFKKGVLVMVLTFIAIGIDAGITEAINENEFFKLENWQRPVDLSYQYIIGLIVSILLPMYFVRKWTIEYNEKIETPVGQ